MKLAELAKWIENQGMKSSAVERCTLESTRWEEELSAGRLDIFGPISKTLLYFTDIAQASLGSEDKNALVEEKTWLLLQ